MHLVARTCRPRQMTVIGGRANARKVLARPARNARLRASVHVAYLPGALDTGTIIIEGVS